MCRLMHLPALCAPKPFMSHSNCLHSQMFDYTVMHIDRNYKQYLILKQMYSRLTIINKRWLAISFR